MVLFKILCIIFVFLFIVVENGRYGKSIYVRCAWQRMG